MKRLIYYVIIAMSISLAFSQGTPCCNKKTNKNSVSCKLNHTVIEADKDVAEKLMRENTNGNQNSLKCNRTDRSKCANSCANKKPWWKFWAKKSSKNCLCKQAQAAHLPLAEAKRVKAKIITTAS